MHGALGHLVSNLVTLSHMHSSCVCLYTYMRANVTERWGTCIGLVDAVESSQNNCVYRATCLGMTACHDLLLHRCHMSICTFWVVKLVCLSWGQGLEYPFSWHKTSGLMAVGKQCLCHHLGKTVGWSHTNATDDQRLAHVVK